MAKIEYIHSKHENTPGFTETIEVRPWGLVGRPDQIFYIGSGFNFQASGSIWLEISYSVEGAQIFYTRTFLHQLDESDAQEVEQRLDAVVKKGEGSFSFVGMLPETCLELCLEKSTYRGPNNDQEPASIYNLKIAADTGVVLGRSAPGERFVEINLPFMVDENQAVQFMRALIHEIDTVQQGKHPDPVSFPAGSSQWPLIGQINRQAYDKISEDYQEAYFKNPLLTKAFDGWLVQLPKGGRVLDAGCGHGDPVITRLLEKGFQVTGSDFSPAMLRRASERFPQVEFIQQVTTEITTQSTFDGICSFNSVVYLDLIDLLNSIRRLHAALKPGGLLFLYGFDTGPNWRGEPFGHRVGQWMWSWHYGMDELAGLLQEHGYFEVLDSCKVQVDVDEANRIAREEERQKKEADKGRKRQKEKHLDLFPIASSLPVDRSPYAYVIIARRLQRS